MTYLKQFTVILALTLVSEGVAFLLPLPIPASIYGILLLLALLCSGALKVESIKDVSSFLVQIMPVMFIPAAVGLMQSFGLLLPALPAYVVILVASTIAVMIVSGRAAQAVIRRNHRKERG